MCFILSTIHPANTVITSLECLRFGFAVYRHSKNISLAQALAEGVFDGFNHIDILRKRNKKKNNSANKLCLELDSNSLRERKHILDSLRCQQNEHLLGVLEEEQQQETMRQITLQKIFDPHEKVKSSQMNEFAS